MATGIGRRFAEARAAAGMTQKELAQRVGVSTSAISGYETEERGVDVADILKIARATGFHHHYLAFGELPRRPDEETPASLPSPPPLDPDLLYQCIAALERVVVRDKLQMSPESKAWAIVGLYQTRAHLPDGAVAAELEEAVRRARK